MSDDTTRYPVPAAYRCSPGHRIDCELDREEARLLYAVLWQALIFADNKSYQMNLMAMAERKLPELRLQADEVGRLANVFANVLRKFGLQPPTTSGEPAPGLVLPPPVREIKELP